MIGSRGGLSKMLLIKKKKWSQSLFLAPFISMAKVELSSRAEGKQ